MKRRTENKIVLVVRKTRPRGPGSFPWEADYLRFSVREPWPSKNSGADITFGKVRADSRLRIRSLMPENGVILSDGIEADFLRFNAGTLADITVADKRGRLVT